ncbi:hypothetical protein OTU49_005907, partial [Cherax quadricarinatus]
MFRQRLRGGHKVGAPNSVNRSLQGQTGFSQQTGSLIRPPSQFSTSVQPSHPEPPLQSRQHEQSQQKHQHPLTGNSGSGWCGDSSDGAWNWGDGDAWSWNANLPTNSQHQQLNQHQQSVLNQHQQSLLNQQHQHQPAQEYDQHHSYSQHLQYASQQQFSKAAQNAPVNSKKSSLNQDLVPSNIS